MSHTADIKRERMHLRLDQTTKRKLERAAAYEKTTVSEFVLANAVDAAKRVIERNEATALSPRDWGAFHDALLDPPEPNRHLREAVRRYRSSARK
jgi:uncharacterized protein (DUF1778 family)